MTPPPALPQLSALPTPHAAPPGPAAKPVDPAAFNRELKRARERADAAESKKPPAAADKPAHGEATATAMPQPRAQGPAKPATAAAAPRTSAAGSEGKPAPGSARVEQEARGQADAADERGRHTTADANAALALPLGTPPLAPVATAADAMPAAGPGMPGAQATLPAAAALPAAAQERTAAALGENEERAASMAALHSPAHGHARAPQAADTPAQPGSGRAGSVAIDRATDRATDRAADGLATGKPEATEGRPAAGENPAQALPNAQAATPAWAKALEHAMGAVAATPTPQQADLALAPGSREFAPALGAQLALFLRDGIQQAELTLHPAELGPILVNIALNGTVAQVDFQAVNAFTRDALEQAMPALASALQDAGFSLGGSDVSDPRHPPGQPGQPGQPGEPGSRSRADDARGAAAGASDWRDNSLAAPRAARRGVLDLYA